MRKTGFFHYRKGLLCLTLAMAMLSSFVLPSVAAAGFIRSTETASDGLVQEDQSLLRTNLENMLIQERLEQMGLSTEEALERVGSLTPEEREAVVQQLEAIQAAGAGSLTMTWVTFLLVLILVILIV